MNVESIMSQNIVTVKLDSSLKQIKQIFDDARFHHVLVVDAGKLFGVISDRDLLRNLSPKIGTLHETNKDLATLKKRSHQILTRKPITLYPHSNIHEAIEIFVNHNISCIPVVNEESAPVGIVSWRDILKALHHISLSKREYRNKLNTANPLSLVDMQVSRASDQQTQLEAENR